MILFSPGNDYHGLSAGLGGDLDTLLAVGEDDEDSLQLCQDMARVVPDRTLFIAPHGGRGVAMLKDPSFLKRVLDWVKEQP
jgi:hypothetical protein